MIHNIKRLTKLSTALRLTTVLVRAFTDVSWCSKLTFKHNPGGGIFPMIEGILSGGILSGGCGPKTGGVLGVLVGVKMQCKRQFARSGQILELHIFAAPNAAPASVLPAATGGKVRYGILGKKSPRSWSSLHILFTYFDCRNDRHWRRRRIHTDHWLDTLTRLIRGSTAYHCDVNDTQRKHERAPL